MGLPLTSSNTTGSDRTFFSSADDTVRSPERCARLARSSRATMASHRRARACALASAEATAATVGISCRVSCTCASGCTSKAECQRPCDYGAHWACLHTLPSHSRGKMCSCDEQFGLLGSPGGPLFLHINQMLGPAQPDQQQQIRSVARTIEGTWLMSSTFGSSCSSAEQVPCLQQAQISTSGSEQAHLELLDVGGDNV